MSDLTPSQFARLQQVYLDLADIPAADRTAKARALLGDDPILLEQFHELPVNDSIPTAFLEPPRPGPAEAQPDHLDKIGPMVGKYRLLSQLGEGGFGLVYEAEQSEPVRRRVAVKIIKPGMDSRAVITRFTAERQALALMDHPSIARVFDGGSTGAESGHPGLPYFVMELVRGDAITTFCDRERLTLERRIELMIDVCEAVQHAHLKGVIHRDIKPSNVLVFYQDGRPMPKVIDFGVAKAVGHGLTENTLFTHRGQLVGTPAYMSPEQAEMSGVDIDSRTDIYSLGVLLYEVLTSRPPFDPETLRSAGYAEMVRIIREVEPPRPSTRLSTLLRTREGDDSAVAIARARRAELSALTKRLRTDLDWVVMKCLQKERDHRYTTARELAEELRRILKHEPVHAGPPKLVYRTRKFIRRHRSGIAWAGLLALVAGLGLGTSIHLFLRYQDERAKNENLRLELSQAHTITARLITDVPPADAASASTSANPRVAAVIESALSAVSGLERETTRYALLEQETRHLIEMPAPSSRPDLMDMAGLLVQQGDALTSLRSSGPRNLDLAKSAFERAESLLQMPVAQPPDLDQVLLLSRALRGQGDVARVSNTQDADRCYEQAVQVLNVPVFVAADSQLKLDRARSHAERDHALALARQCRTAEAESKAMKVLSDRRRLADTVAAGTLDSLAVKRDVAVAATTLAEIRLTMNQPLAALQNANEALQLRQQLLPLVPAGTDERSKERFRSYQRDVPVSRITVAQCAQALGDFARAEVELSEAESELQALSDQMPDDVRMRATLVRAILIHARLALDTADPASALQHLNRVKPMLESLPGGWERDMELACNFRLLRGTALRLLDQPSAALSDLGEARRLSDAMHGADPVRVEFDRLRASSLVQLAETHLMLAESDPTHLSVAAADARDAMEIYARLNSAQALCDVPTDELAKPPALLERIRSFESR